MNGFKGCCTGSVLLATRRLASFFCQRKPPQCHSRPTPPFVKVLITERALVTVTRSASLRAPALARALSLALTFTCVSHSRSLWHVWNPRRLLSGSCVLFYYVHITAENAVNIATRTNNGVFISAQLRRVASCVYVIPSFGRCKANRFELSHIISNIIRFTCSQRASLDITRLRCWPRASLAGGVSLLARVLVAFTASTSLTQVS